MDLKSGLETVRVLRKYVDGVCIDFRHNSTIEEEGSRSFDGILLIYDGNPSRTMFRREVKTRGGEQDHFIEEGEISSAIGERLQEIPHYELIYDLLTIKQEPRKPSDQK